MAELIDWCRSDWPDGHFKFSSRFMKAMVSAVLTQVVSGGLANNVVLDWSDYWLDRNDGPEERPTHDMVLGDVASGYFAANCLTSPRLASALCC